MEGVTAVTKVIVEIDTVAQAAYIRLSNNAVARTVEVTEEIMVDLDEFDMATGIEILDVHADIPLTTISEKCHIREEVREILQRALPSLRSNIANPLNARGDTDTSGATDLTFA